MEQLNITINLIKEAYSKTNLKPSQNDWTIKNNCTCPLGAIYKYKCKNNGLDIQVFYELSGIDDDFIQSFASGFDGDNYKNGNDQAYELGKLVLKELEQDVI